MVDLTPQQWAHVQASKMRADQEAAAIIAEAKRKGIGMAAPPRDEQTFEELEASRMEDFKQFYIARYGQEPDLDNENTKEIYAVWLAGRLGIRG